jgi:hypothetical protein
MHDATESEFPIDKGSGAGTMTHETMRVQRIGRDFENPTPVLYYQQLTFMMVNVVSAYNVSSKTVDIGVLFIEESGCVIRVRPS